MNRHHTRLSVLFIIWEVHGILPANHPRTAQVKSNAVGSQEASALKAVRGQLRAAGEGRELQKRGPRIQFRRLAGPRAQGCKGTRGSRDPAGRDRKGGLQPGAPSPAGRRAGPSPRPGLTPGRKSGSRGAGERGGTRLTGGRGPAPLPGGRLAGRRSGMEARAQACADGGRGSGASPPGLHRQARPPGAPPSPPLLRVPPLHVPARPRGPRALPRPARSSPARRPPPAARRSGRRASAAPAPPGPGAAGGVAPPLRLSGRSAGWRSSGRPVAGLRAETPLGRPRSPPPLSRVVPGAGPPRAVALPGAQSPRRLPLGPSPLRPSAPLRHPGARPRPGPGTALPPPARAVLPGLGVWGRQTEGRVVGVPRGGGGVCV